MLEPGELIDIWVVERALGSGGMGSVYRCHNRTANRILAAVKVLDSSMKKHPEAQARFIREAEILFQLDHPNIVKVRNVRTDTDPPYLEMEFVEGDSLENMLAKRGALGFEESVSILQQTCSALAYLHHTGIRHRDMKPANLLVKTDGRVKVVDFGLAMEADTTRITQAGMAFGTVSYAPPEWIRPDVLDPALWDIYATGVIFYECLTGAVAFPVSGQGSARQQAMQVIVGKQSHPALDPGEQFPESVRAVVRAMTEPDPAKRIQTAEEVMGRMNGIVEALTAGGYDIPNPVSFAGELSTSFIVPASPPSDRPQPMETWSEENTDVRELVAEATASQPPPAKPRRGWLIPAVGAAMLLAIGSVGVLGAVVWSTLPETPVEPTPGAEPRAVSLSVTGVPPDQPVSLSVDDVTPLKSSGLRFDFAIPPGEHMVRWAVGTDCGTCSSDDDCAEWCVHGRETLVVAEGSTTLAKSIAATPLSRRGVRIETGQKTVEGRLDGEAGNTDGKAVSFSNVLPGKHTLRLQLGDCAEDVAPCWPDGTCPSGCLLTERELVVGNLSGDLKETIELPEVTRKGPPTGGGTKRPPAGDKPPVEPVVSAGGYTGFVTVGQFARFLEKRPDNQPDRARTMGWADSNYLSNWSGASPPAGTSAGAPVDGVSPTVARNYCRWRKRGGKLPDSSAPDASGSGNQWAEIRWDSGPVAATFGGSPVPMRNNQAMTGVVFRCSK